MVGENFLFVDFQAESLAREGVAVFSVTESCFEFAGCDQFYEILDIDGGNIGFVGIYYDVVDVFPIILFLIFY